MNLKAFLESPENRAGIAIWVGTAVTALLQHFLLHTQLSSADLLGLILGFVKIVQPENTVTVAQLQGTIADTKALFAAASAGKAGKVVSDTGEIITGLSGEASKD